MGPKCTNHRRIYNGAYYECFGAMGGGQKFAAVDVQKHPVDVKSTYIAYV